MLYNTHLRFPARFSLLNMNQCNKKWQCRFSCLIVPNPFKEALRIFQIQAPNMMHVIMAFARSTIFPDWKVSLNQLIILMKVASCDTSVISRINFRHDHCKWKILGRVDGSQNIHHEVFSSHLANYEILFAELCHIIWNLDTPEFRYDFTIFFMYMNHIWIDRSWNVTYEFMTMKSYIIS